MTESFGAHPLAHKHGEDPSKPPDPSLRKPVTIIGGFLRTGKTTLLNHILTHERDLRKEIIIREYGSLPTDHELIEDETADAFQSVVLSDMAQVSQWVQINSGIHNGLGTADYELVTSVPAEETDFWFEPYRPTNPWGVVNRDGMRAQDWMVEPYSHKNLQMSFVEMSTRPKGMVAEREL